MFHEDVSSLKLILDFSAVPFGLCDASLGDPDSSIDRADYEKSDLLNLNETALASPA